MTAFLARTTAVFADPSNFPMSPWLLFLGSSSMIVVSVTLILSNFLTAFFVFIRSPGRLSYYTRKPARRSLVKATFKTPKPLP